MFYTEDEVDVKMEHQQNSGLTPLTPAKSGRKLHPVWEYFVRYPVPGTHHTRAVCKACDYSIVGIPERMVLHARKCPNTTVSEEHLSTTTHNPTKEANHYSTEQMGSTLQQTPQQPEARPTDAKRPKIIRPNPPSFEAGSSASQVESELNMQLTRAIISSKCHFEMADDRQMRAFFAMLRPTVRVADAKTLKGPMLDSVYRQEVGNAKKSVSGGKFNV